MQALGKFKKGDRVKVKYKRAEGRVEKVTDVIKEGEKVKVKLMAIDERGRMNLSIKEANKS